MAIGQAAAALPLVPVGYEWSVAEAGPNPGGAELHRGLGAAGLGRSGVAHVHRHSACALGCQVRSPEHHRDDPADIGYTPGDVELS